MSSVAALHIQTGRGACFALHHAVAGGKPKGQLLYLHPFAEEMNKTRRMAALQARAFAAAGFEVLQIDLHGCGDSAGDFADASWEAWIDDALLGARWLRQRSASPETPFWFWGLRAGALVAAGAAALLGSPCHCLFWQPSTNGKLVLQQFLRLKLAGDLDGGRGKAMMNDMRQALAAGQAVEIAGYELASATALGLERATLAPPPQAARLVWLEVSPSPDAELLPASAPVLARWAQAGWTTTQQVVPGPAFWQSVEIEEAPALVAATLAAIDS